MINFRILTLLGLCGLFLSLILGNADFLNPYAEATDDSKTEPSHYQPKEATTSSGQTQTHDESECDKFWTIILCLGISVLESTPVKSVLFTRGEPDPEILKSSTVSFIPFTYNSSCKTQWVVYNIERDFQMDSEDGMSKSIKNADLSFYRNAEVNEAPIPEKFVISHCLYGYQDKTVETDKTVATDKTFANRVCLIEPNLLISLANIRENDTDVQDEDKKKQLLGIQESAKKIQEFVLKSIGSDSEAKCYYLKNPNGQALLAQFNNFTAIGSIPGNEATCSAAVVCGVVALAVLVILLFVIIARCCYWSCKWWNTDPEGRGSLISFLWSKFCRSDAP